MCWCSFSFTSRAWLVPLTSPAAVSPGDTVPANLQAATSTHAWAVVTKTHVVVLELTSDLLTWVQADISSDAGSVVVAWKSSARTSCTSIYAASQEVLQPLLSAGLWWLQIGAFCSPGRKSRSFLLDEIFTTHLFFLGHRNHCIEQRLKPGIWRGWRDEMAVWSPRINGNLKSHSGSPGVLGIRLTHSVDREQKLSLLRGTSHPHTCKCSQGFSACVAATEAFTGWVYQSHKHAPVWLKGFFFLLGSCTALSCWPLFLFN